MLTAQGFEDVEMVLSGAIDYIRFLETRARDDAREAALLQELVKLFESQRGTCG